MRRYVNDSGAALIYNADIQVAELIPVAGSKRVDLFPIPRRWIKQQM